MASCWAPAPPQMQLASTRAQELQCKWPGSLAIWMLMRWDGIFVCSSFEQAGHDEMQCWCYLMSFSLKLQQSNRQEPLNFIPLVLRLPTTRVCCQESVDVFWGSAYAPCLIQCARMRTIRVHVSTCTLSAHMNKAHAMAKRFMRGTTNAQTTHVLL